MQLLDLSQVCFAAIAQEKARAKGKDLGLSEDMAMHFIFNSIRSNNKKFRNDYGEMIICADSKSWRKDFYPHYKYLRSVTREQDDDFDTVVSVMNKVKMILRDHSPFRVVETFGAEADDCIATIVNAYGRNETDDMFGGIGTNNEDILIISGDKDFQQLQCYSNVYQFSPTLKKFLKCPDPHEFRAEHVATGDQGDGVPNILSPDDFYYAKHNEPGKYSKAPSITKAIKKEISENFEAYLNGIGKNEEIQKGFNRNFKLVDLLGSTPEHIQGDIMKSFEKGPSSTLEGLRTTFIELRMRNLLDTIGDFKVNRNK